MSNEALPPVTARQRASERLRDWVELHGWFVLALGVLTLLAGLPLFQFKEMAGHDSNAYLPRFVEFYEGLKGGVIFPRWAPDLAWGYGEPTFSFNPPLIYYVGSAYHALGFTFIASEDLTAFTLLVIAAAGMYLLASDFFGRHGGLVAATAYVYAPFLLMRLYVNHALADFAGFAFLPFAFWGLYGAVAKGSRSHALLAALSIAALMLTSLSVIVMVFPVMLLCTAGCAWAQRSLMGAIRGAWSIGLGLALSAFFWIPAMSETSFVHIDRRETRLDYHDHFLYVWQLIHSPWGYGLSVRGSGDGFSFEIGPVHIALTIAAVLLLRHVWRASRPAGVFLACFLLATAGAIFMTLEPSLFIWDRVGALHPLQFPWRFLTIIAMTTAFFCGVPFLLLGEERAGIARWLMVAMIGAIFLLNFRHADPSGFVNVTDATYSPANIAANGLPATAREFEPIGVRVFPQTPRPAVMTVLSGSADIGIGTKTPTERRFSIRANEDSRLRLHTFYLPGWTLYVDGKETPTDHANDYGLIDFALPPGTHSVRFVFQDTPVRTWSTRLSLLGIVLLVLTPFAMAALSRREGRDAGVSA